MALLLANKIDDIPVSTPAQSGHFAPDLELNYSEQLLGSTVKLTLEFVSLNINTNPPADKTLK